MEEKGKHFTFSFDYCCMDNQGCSVTIAATVTCTDISVLKCSCTHWQTYKTHLEGKNHKKRLQQQQNVSKESKGGENYCELCDVVCSNRDAFEAHVRGSKHQKVLTLHRRLGKPIPQINVPSTTGTQTTTGGKTVMVAAPRLVCPATEGGAAEQRLIFNYTCLSWLLFFVHVSIVPLVVCEFWRPTHP